MNKLISNIIEKNNGPYYDAGIDVIRVSGIDNKKFLQGQLTNDIVSLQDQKYKLASYCTHQGKVISNMQLILNDDDIIILLPKHLSEYFIEKISKYILMSKVEFSIDSKSVVLSGLGEEALSIINKYSVTIPGGYKKIDNSSIIINMSTSSIPQCRCILFDPEQKVDIAYANSDQHTTCLIDLFNLITRLRVENIEKYIPQVLNADKLDTVNYKKGCYTGQEVIARTHYLGNVKKHVYLVKIHAVEINEKNIINNDGESVGELIGESFIHDNVTLSHCILRDSCDFDELFIEKVKVSVISMEETF
jgi:folate-binding protein YgfZ